MSVEPAPTAPMLVRRTGLPYAQVAVDIVRDPRLSPGARLLYVILATFANLSDRSAFPTRATLADHVGRSLDTVDRGLRELVEANLVRITHRTSPNGDPTSSLYELLDVPDLSTGVAASVRPPSRMGAARGSRTSAAQKENQYELGAGARETRAAARGPTVAQVLDDSRACAHGDPRGSNTCPLCRARIAPYEETG